MFYLEIFPHNVREKIDAAYDAIAAQDSHATVYDERFRTRRPACTTLAHLAWDSRAKRMFISTDTRISPEYTAWINAPFWMDHAAPLDHLWEIRDDQLYPTHLAEWTRVGKIREQLQTACR